MEYLLNQEQKEYMKKIHEINEKKSEKEKQDKYNQLFVTKPKEDLKENVAIVEYKESFIKKIINKIKNFLRINIGGLYKVKDVVSKILKCKTNLLHFF